MNSKNEENNLKNIIHETRLEKEIYFSENLHSLDFKVQLNIFSILVQNHKEYLKETDAGVVFVLSNISDEVLDQIYDITYQSKNYKPK